MFKFVIFGYHVSTTNCCNYMLNQGSQVLHGYPESRRIARIDHGAMSYCSFSSIRSQRLFDTIAEFEPDYIISLICKEKIPAEIVKLARFYGLNIHPARLPQCRTANAWFWPIRLGHTRSAITVHLLEDTYDSGGIVYSHEFAIDLKDNQESCSKKIVKEIGIAVDNLYQLMASDKINPEPQRGEASYYGMIKNLDICIDWNDTTRSVYDLIRACNPNHPAITHYKNQLFGVYEARLTERRPSSPGQLHIEDGRIYCSCGDGVLELTVCRFNGIVSARNLILSMGLKTKEYLTCSATVPSLAGILNNILA